MLKLETYQTHVPVDAAASRALCSRIGAQIACSMSLLLLFFLRSEEEMILFNEA